MFFTLNDMDRRTVTQLRALNSLHPVPQFPAWEGAAKLLFEKGFRVEASSLLDIAAQHYGRDSGRLATERVTHIPLPLRGRGLAHRAMPVSHPALFALRDHTQPLRIGRNIILRSGNNIIIAAPDSPDIRLVNAISRTPAVAPLMTANHNPVDWIAIDTCLLFTEHDRRLNIVDLSNIDNLDDSDILPSASILFDKNITHLSGPLNDGTFFIALEPDMPVFSDICKLCQINISKLKESFTETPTQTIDIQNTDLFIKNIQLHNIEQHFFGDCIPAGDVFMTCGGGMQNQEIRFIDTNGSWTTKFIHEAPVIRVLISENGPVSIDSAGLAYLWKQQKPIDDISFDLSKLPDFITTHLNQSTISIDWTHHSLYFNHTDATVSTLASALNTMHSCRLTQDSIESNTFTKTFYYLDGIVLAMLANGSFHFWDMKHQCVDVRWQLPQTCAEAVDWQEVLNADSPAIELDPRIRIIRF